MPDPEVNVEDHFGLAIKIVSKWLARHRIRPLADIRDHEEFQEACRALCVAKRHYDPSRGVKFSTYATWKITGYLRHLRDNRHAAFNRTMESRPTCGMDSLCRDSDPARQAERAELNAAMRIAVRRLPEPERTCVQLQLAGHDVNEISRIMEWRRVDVDRIYTAGLGMLREQLDERFGNGKSEDAVS